MPVPPIGPRPPWEVTAVLDRLAAECWPAVDPIALIAAAQRLREALSSSVESGGGLERLAAQVSEAMPNHGRHMGATFDRTAAELLKAADSLHGFSLYLRNAAQRIDATQLDLWVTAALALWLVLQLLWAAQMSGGASLLLVPAVLAAARQAAIDLSTALRQAVGSIALAEDGARIGAQGERNLGRLGFNSAVVAAGTGEVAAKGGALGPAVGGAPFLSGRLGSATGPVVGSLTDRPGFGGIRFGDGTFAEELWAAGRVQVDVVDDPTKGWQLVSSWSADASVRQWAVGDATGGGPLPPPPSGGVADVSATVGGGPPDVPQAMPAVVHGQDHGAAVPGAGHLGVEPVQHTAEPVSTAAHVAVAPQATVAAHLTASPSSAVGSSPAVGSFLAVGSSPAAALPMVSLPVVTVQHQPVAFGPAAGSADWHETGTVHHTGDAGITAVSSHREAARAGVLPAAVGLSWSPAADERVPGYAEPSGWPGAHGGVLPAVDTPSTDLLGALFAALPAFRRRELQRSDPQGSGRRALRRRLDPADREAPEATDGLALVRAYAAEFAQPLTMVLPDSQVIRLGPEREEGRVYLVQGEDGRYRPSAAPADGAAAVEVPVGAEISTTSARV
ncbi:hypothetical protein [Kitasatospora sp. NPDC093102]|uniref:hypothetical protein n=1 Tax=Kitasatospora sp. NPDC093102 TaxID=3155069 RepID=UPI00342F9B86